MNRDELLNYVLSKLAEAPILALQKTTNRGIVYKERRILTRIKKLADDYTDFKNVEDRIIVLPGLRGLGKTTAMLQFYTHLTQVKKVDQDRVLYFSADEMANYLGAKIIDIVRIFVESIHGSSLATLEKPLYILIDEAHYDKEWDMAAKIVYDNTKNIFIMLSGSSALNLEMSVDLSRRARKEPLFPLNFSEYALLKNNIYPAKDTAINIRELIFNPTQTSISNGIEKWSYVQRKLLNLRKPLDIEFERYLCFGGFPFGLGQDEKFVCERIFAMVNRIVQKDVPTIKSYNTNTLNLINRIIYYLALQLPGETSDDKLSQKIGASSKLIRSILDVLEKTHLIFSIKPQGGAGTVAKKPWKYYFLSPSINAAIRYKLGNYNLKDRRMLGLFAETMVGSYFFRMKETIGVPLGIYYDPEKAGVDFLIQKEIDNIIPVEVTIGNKGTGQLKKAMIKYKSKHAVLISDSNEISTAENIVRIPITYFSFV